ncbi:uncharacterized protein LOC107228189 [Neodiprion lecontei]|uniref:Uncharacterized protein LOC107228189 n=1 Tax=Neodiprion lecontei TaxID=441921 RepID=A0A6J0CCF6_NEOLC|nr:uncharacterized protein LOC107228189 [Neodiprion lecontei]
MYGFKMCQRTILLLLLVSSTHCQLFNFTKLKSYVNIFNIKGLYPNETGNVLWQGLLKDCAKKASFSCIQKNVYTYLDSTFADRDNITVFDGFTLTKNNLDYHKYLAEYNEKNHDEGYNNIDETDGKSSTGKQTSRKSDENYYVEPVSPLEEVTNALHDKTIKFLATKDYELQLPNFFFEGTSIKISPKEVDEDGAIIRVDFKQRAITEQGRLFHKIKKFIKNKLLTSFLALLLIIKLIKIKFFFIIPFLFGVGTAKKLFLKVLLFLVPAFAHVFKLCSSYYSGGTKYHHHHHQIAHHHHHVPVPVPVPTFHHEHHPHHHEEEEFDGYDYTQPHIQYRKDMEELREWGIASYEDPGVLTPEPYAGVQPVLGPYGVPQYAANARPVTVVPNQPGSYEKYGPQIKYDKPVGPYENPNPNIRHTLSNIGMTQFNKNLGLRGPVSNLGPIGNHAQGLAYNGYFDEVRFTRAAAPVTEPSMAKVPYHPQQQHQQQNHLFSSQIRPGTTFSKNSGFTSKSDNANAWLNSSPTVDIVKRIPHSVQPTSKSPIYTQNGQLGNQPAQNVAKPYQQISQVPQNFQHALALNPVTVAQKSTYNLQSSQQRIAQQDNAKNTQSDASRSQLRAYDDEFYGPIVGRLDEIFKQLRFLEEDCRERLICSMYKNPAVYTPHSNLVSNELSREADELRQGNRESASGRRFQRYMNAARAGQDRGDCHRLYSCHISTE